METESLDSHERTCGDPEVEDHILLEEIKLLGAVIADVRGRATHLSPKEIDQVLERAGTAELDGERCRRA